MRQSIKVGASEFHLSQCKVTGKFVEINGEQFYCIENYDQMAPFFMSVVSSSDHWMFISSTGGLTAGRKNAEAAVFPYETDDKVSESSQNTGPLSLFLITKGNSTYLWEPLSDRYSGLYKTERKIYKNIIGNKLIFEETNLDLGITFRQAWRTSDRFGFILMMWLHNQSTEDADINLLSGIRNILPFGVTTTLQTTFSNLLNAYKRSELEMMSGLGIFSLSSTLTDLAEPSESLKATTAWQVGLEHPSHLLSSFQLDDFKNGVDLSAEVDVRGVRGAYLLNKSIRLEGNEIKEWAFIIDVEQDSADIAQRINMLKRPAREITNSIEADITEGDKALRAIIASADGLQVTRDQLSSTHHFANVLFNTMRGGTFADNYQIQKPDLIDFIHTRNRDQIVKHKQLLEKLPENIPLEDLLTQAGKCGDANFIRLCYGYLPLTFSRRHGDPSRPWNRFSINLKNEDGSQRLDYQGNWRDIFQNWEALACSYPEFVESMISVFVNAGTPDGYNPYRVTREGVEWEVPEPENPWANIGYWSDHQIIYLLKLLELSSRYHPGKLKELLSKQIFSYVNVPYRLKRYADIVNDPYQTITFDFEAHNQIEEEIASFGMDRKLIRLPDGEIYHVNLNEKMLIFLLAKLVNFVPEGGIWMNTQRPEWNDANNALVGKGLSVVTLCYLRRYVVFWQSLLNGVEDSNVKVSSEVYSLFEAVLSILSEYSSKLNAPFSDRERRDMMDLLGQSGSGYRWQIYQQGFCGEFQSISVSKLVTFLKLSTQFVEHSLQANQREDGLYHSYNILVLDPDTAKVGHLYEMLEGQVSVLSSGFLKPQEGLTLLSCLRESALYRADQHSYILYPDRNLPAFITKNRLPPAQTQAIDLVMALVNNDEKSLIIQDENGDFHFNGMFRNADDVRQALEHLSQQNSYKDLVSSDGEKVLNLFEDVFHHASFTGRSGTFFAYEGLGSIYWHMVSKLLLATQENILWAVEQNTEPETIQGLLECYYDLRLGLGFNKTPDVFGAFPTDPYSHTPKGQGAKQPGMTGQVKEEILTRLAELGVFVKNGQISFNPILLRVEEFLTQPDNFEYIDLNGKSQRVSLPAGSLAFTICQTPIIYLLCDRSKLQVHFSDGRMEELSGSRLDKTISQRIFKRDGTVAKISVFMERTQINL